MYPEVSKEDEVFRILKGWQWNRERHGCLFDRGSADSYYGRGPSPHYGGVGGDSGETVTLLNTEEIAEYMAGYRYNEKFGEKKNYL